jgi:hypothetical protein
MKVAKLVRALIGQRHNVTQCAAEDGASVTSIGMRWLPTSPELMHGSFASGLRMDTERRLSIITSWTRSAARPELRNRARSIARIPGRNRKANSRSASRSSLPMARAKRVSSDAAWSANDTSFSWCSPCDGLWEKGKLSLANNSPLHNERRVSFCGITHRSDLFETKPECNEDHLTNAGSDSTWTAC